MNGKERVNLSKVIEKMNLVNLTPDKIGRAHV